MIREGWAPTYREVTISELMSAGAEESRALFSLAHLTNAKLMMAPAISSSSPSPMAVELRGEVGVSLAHVTDLGGGQTRSSSLWVKAPPGDLKVGLKQLFNMVKEGRIEVTVPGCGLFSGTTIAYNAGKGEFEKQAPAPKL